MSLKLLDINMASYSGTGWITCRHPQKAAELGEVWEHMGTLPTKPAQMESASENPRNLGAFRWNAVIRT